MIPESLLIAYGAILKTYEKDEEILEKDHPAKFFFQIKKGRVKMYNLSEDGKEFVLGFFDEGKSFAEPPLLGDFEYPANAIASEKSEVYKLNKEQFLLLLKENFETHLQLNNVLCNRLKYKSMIMSEISVHNPEHQILTLLNYLKKNSNTLGKYEVELTRQQLADLTGLRVETVIRAVKSLDKQNKVEIINRKIFV